MKLIELTTDSSRRVGLPQLSAVVLLGLEAKPNPEHPKAKTMVRYATPGGARHVFLKDSFRQIRNLFPTSLGGAGWTEARDAMGNEIAFPEGTITAYEEQEKQEGEKGDRFWVQLGCETGPLEFVLSCTYREFKAMMGETEPEAAEEAPARKRHRAMAPPRPPAGEPPQQKGR
jgi:hypothetical protein